MKLGHIQEWPYPKFTTLEEANEWAKKLVMSLEEDQALSIEEQTMLDEDDMVSNSLLRSITQQSAKSYMDDAIDSAGDTWNYFEQDANGDIMPKGSGFIDDAIWEFDANEDIQPQA